MSSNYITTYRKDFKQKKTKYNKASSHVQEFEDPVGESFRQYLELGKHSNGSRALTCDSPFENVEDYLKKFKDVYPKLGKMYFSGPINKQMLERSFVMDSETIYQSDYCNKEKDQEYVEKLRQMSVMILPSGWMVPLTTQNASYRDVQLLDPNALKKVALITPQHNLKNPERIFKILGVRTGESEYSRVIGKLGQSIVEDHLHGKIYHPQF